MKWIKLTAYTLSLFSFLLSITACEKDDEKKKTTDYSRTNIVMSGAQEVPANPSTATGSMDVFYSKATKTLTYTVRWSGLTDSVLLMHIHGLAPVGYSAGVFQNIVINSTSPNTLYPQKTNGKFTFGKSGSLSGSLYIDGVAIKEVDLLNGFYYMNIHTNGVNPNGGTYAGGEIRGQIVFQ